VARAPSSVGTWASSTAGVRRCGPAQAREGASVIDRVDAPGGRSVDVAVLVETLAKDGERGCVHCMRLSA
jgi:hypothetical protein